MSTPHRSASVLQITDLHLLERPGAKLLGIDTAASLDAVLEAALAERQPAAVLVTGDIAHEPTVPTYRRFLALLRQRFEGPLLCLPGNHDRLAPLLAAGLPTAPIILDGWWLTGWDTHEDERPAARFNASAWQTLCDWVERAGPMGVVATHHPLVDVDCPWLDKDSVRVQKHIGIRPTQRVRSFVSAKLHTRPSGREGSLMPPNCYNACPRWHQ